MSARAARVVDEGVLEVCLTIVSVVLVLLVVVVDATVSIAKRERDALVDLLCGGWAVSMMMSMFCPFCSWSSRTWVGRRGGCFSK